MNREIKFRAWHKPTSKMYQFDIMDGMKSGTGGGYIPMCLFGESITKTIHKDNLHPIDPQDCDIMQFTGIKDKAGIEIYEGDNLELANGEIITVYFKAGGFLGIRKNGTTSLTSFYWIYSKIIGNIYESK